MNDYNNINNNNKKNIFIMENKENKELKKATDNFEAIYVKKMLEIAYRNSDVGGTGPGKEIIKGMYLDAISNSGQGSIGISKMLYDSLIQGQKK